MLTEISFLNDKFFVNRLPDSIETQALISEISDLINYYYTENSFTFHTSGTTGIPKEINFCRDEIVSSAKLTASCFDLKTDSRVLLALPTRYVAGKMMVYRAIVNQWKLVIAAPSSNPLVELITPIDFAALTPHQLAVVFEQCPEKLSLVQTIICGGGRVGKELADRIHHSGIHVFETYGMTETLTHVAVKALHRRETSFRALPGIFFERGEDECLIIQCAHLFSSPIITQDVVEIISPTEMRWRGRKDFVVNSGGIKISPEKIEDVLSNVFHFPFYIGGVPDEILGERLVIFVEEIPSNFAWQEILRECCLANYERPKEMIALGKFERTHAGKIIRKRMVQ